MFLTFYRSILQPNVMFCNISGLLSYKLAQIGDMKAHCDLHLRCFPEFSNACIVEHKILSHRQTPPEVKTTTCASQATDDVFFLNKNDSDVCN